MADHDRRPGSSSWRPRTTRSAISSPRWPGRSPSLDQRPTARLPRHGQPMRRPPAARPTMRCSQYTYPTQWRSPAACRDSAHRRRRSPETPRRRTRAPQWQAGSSSVGRRRSASSTARHCRDAVACGSGRTPRPAPAPALHQRPSPTCMRDAFTTHTGGRLASSAAPGEFDRGRVSPSNAGAMARIILADDGIRFDGRLAETAPMGGAETAVVGLAEALARRGHEVAVYNKCGGPLDWNGVAWRPINTGLPESADLYIANRGDRLLPLVPRARVRAFWIHNPAGYLLKWRYLWKLARWRPAIVFSGAFHASTYPRWAPDGGRAIVPLGVAETFRAPEPCGAGMVAASPPPPRAVFTSSPLRSLDWLLDLWSEAIRPRVPGAELYVFSGPQTYGGG